MHTELTKSIDRVKKKAKNYRMHGLAGNSQEDLPREDAFFNDLEQLDPTYRPSLLAIWSDDDKFVKGIQMRYTSGEKKAHGVYDESKGCHYLTLDTKGDEIIFEMQVEVASVKLTVKSTPTGKIPQIDSPPPKAAKDGAETPLPLPLKFQDPQPGANDHEPKPAAVVTTTVLSPFLLTRPDIGTWSVRGFFGFSNQSADRFLGLGIVWGRDKFVPRPSLGEALPLCKYYLSNTIALQNDIRKIFGTRPSFAGCFVMGELLSVTLAAAPGLPGARAKYFFNDLWKLEEGSKIKSIQFHCEDGKLTGRFPTGAAPKVRKWLCEVDIDLISVKMTRVKADNGERL